MAVRCGPIVTKLLNKEHAQLLLLSARCIGASDRLVNSGRPSGMSGWPADTARIRPSSERSQDSFLFCYDLLTMWNAVYCIQKSCNWRKAHKIMKWTHLLDNAYLKDRIFRAFATSRSLVQGSLTECVRVWLSVIECNNNPLHLQLVGRRSPSKKIPTARAHVSTNAIGRTPTLYTYKNTQKGQA
jgi:hypothetical protein